MSYIVKAKNHVEILAPTTFPAGCSPRLKNEIENFSKWITYFLSSTTIDSTLSRRVRASVYPNHALKYLCFTVSCFREPVSCGSAFSDNTGPNKTGFDYLYKVVTGNQPALHVQVSGLAELIPDPCFSSK
jgi:hypothetical protein